MLISARLDGTGDRLKTRMAAHTSIKDWLELDDTRDDSPLRTGQKRVGGSTVVKYIYRFARCFQVRWADIEQRKRQARTAQFGFVVGQRNWATQEDREAEASRCQGLAPPAEVGSRQRTRTGLGCRGTRWRC